MKKYLISILIVLAMTTSALAKVNVVTTLPFIGSIAKEIGKDKIDLTTLVKPSQDPHFAEPKPGIPPSVGYLTELVELIKKSKPNAILATEANGKKESEYFFGHENNYLFSILPFSGPSFSTAFSEAFISYSERNLWRCPSTATAAFSGSSFSSSVSPLSSSNPYKWQVYSRFFHSSLCLP